MLYAAGIRYRNRRFDHGIGVSRLDRPVISVGNLSTGGTGKTPMVHWIAQELLDMGCTPAIAMRGYKAPPGGKGDEQLEHESALPGVPVVARPDRLAGLRELFETEGGRRVDSVVLDDGFQHRRIARDMDIVLIDASAPPSCDALLPLGNLREPVSSLRRVGAIVITRRELVTDTQLAALAAWIADHAPGIPVAVASHVWTGADVFERTTSGWAGRESGFDQLRGESVLGVCAIGNPGGFFGMIEDAGMRLAARMPLRDHAGFDKRTVDAIDARMQASGAAHICMTRKDWVKARDSIIGESVIVPRLGIRFHTGIDGLRAGIRDACQGD